MKYLLYPFSFLYGTVLTIRNLLFDIGILPSHSFPLWVISIGNLSMGGTGKSPHVEYLARLLEKLNSEYQNLDLPYNKIAALSRGYGRGTQGFLLVNSSSNAREIGDEPMQLKKNLPDMYVGVDEKRVRGIDTLMMLNPQLRMVLLDDAFQHRYVKPTLSILLTNYNAPFYNDHMLPVGHLRESRSGYKRAQFIIVTNVPTQITDIEKKMILKNINPKSSQKIFFSSVFYESLLPVYKGAYTIPIIDKNCSVLLLTGIANTYNIENYLTEISKEIIHLPFSDHHVFESSDIAKVIKSFNAITNPNKIIITTEKDSVRLQLGELRKDFGVIPVFYLPIRVKVHDEQHFADALISNLPPLNPTKPIRKL